MFTFILINLAPGDPAEIILRSKGIEPNEKAVETLREEMGLNKSIHIRYIKWFWNICHLRFGDSYKSGRPVLQEIAKRFPATLELSITSMIITFMVAIPVGIISALYKHSFLDHIIRLAALIGASTPSFWLGFLLIYFFAVRMNFFPIMGRGGIDHIVLPAITLGMSMTAVYIRMLRASMIEILGQDFIKVTKAKGLKRKWIIGRHAFKNSLLPIITLFGMGLGDLLGGAMIVETIFSWPGIGKYVIDAIFARDYPVIQAFVIFMAIIFVLLNLLVDISYAVIDPSICIKKENSYDRYKN